MAIVNFAIPKMLEKRIGVTIKEKGFASKAEFFRFAAVYFMDTIDKPYVSENDRTAYLVGEIGKEVSRIARGARIQSLSEQLKDI